MSVYRLRIGRWEIFSWEVERDSADVLAQAIADLTDDDDEITGGGSHDFERDLQPPDPMREEPWEDRRLGFR